MSQPKPSLLQDIRSVLRLPLYAFFLGLTWLRQRKLFETFPIYQQDGLISIHNWDFHFEPRFQKAYRQAVEKGLFAKADIHWRAHTLCWAANQVLGKEGDFVECGVFKGFMAHVVMDYTAFHSQKKRKFYLLDTFEGMPEEQFIKEERKTKKAVYQSTYDLIQKTFSKYPNVEIVKGVIPGTLSRIRSKKVALVHIDMNAVKPEIAAAAYLWPKMVSGGIMILDDYGHRPHVPQKIAFQQFARNKKVEILTLPTGQGLLIKP